MLIYLVIVVFFTFCGYLIYLLFIKREALEQKPKVSDNVQPTIDKEQIPNIEAFDFNSVNAYYFKPDFSLKYAEPMMITLFKDENEYLNFAIHCTDSNKYKIGYVSDLVFEDSLGFNLSLTWEYYRFDGYSDRARVEMFLVQQNTRVRFMCHVLNSDRSQNTYIGEQLSTKELNC